MNKRNIIIAVCLVLVIFVGWMILGRGKKKETEFKESRPFIGRIETSITATGTVQPQNRLEIKPPISGRIDKILVEEGQKVKVGDILALMSSTDRAALLDAAKLQGGETLKNWEEVYKATPLIASLDGDVIVKAVNPGQTVTTADAVIVLSDRLIVQAQVDETDIGKVKVGQEARISLDAYPGIEVRARVDHIYYESTIMNNVTIYKVDIVPENVPEVFRSGMSANVTIVQESKDDVLLIPLEAVKKSEGRDFVMLSQGRGTDKQIRTEVKLGINDGNNVEVLSGLSLKDTIAEPISSYKIPDSNSDAKRSPFMPGPPGGRRGR